MCNPDIPFAVGETFGRSSDGLGRCTVVVEELTPDGRPMVVSFDFHVRREDPLVRWVARTPDGLVDFVPPSIGETKDVDAAWPWL